jgi:hypothetical protein
MHKQINKRLEKYFDPARSEIDSFDKNKIKQKLGFELTPRQMLGLCGAPTGSKAKVEFITQTEQPPGPNDPERKVEVLPDGVKIRVTHPKWIDGENTVILYFDASADAVGIYIALVYFKDFPVDGAGALMIQCMLNAIKALPEAYQVFKQIRLMAAGGRSWGVNEKGEYWIGYNVWPKMGFDMPLTSPTLEVCKYFERYPPGILSCQTVSEVLALPKGGNDFWRVVGDGWIMTFDVGSVRAQAALTRRLEKSLAVSKWRKLWTLITS